MCTYLKGEFLGSSKDLCFRSDGPLLEFTLSFPKNGLCSLHLSKAATNPSCQSSSTLQHLFRDADCDDNSNIKMIDTTYNIILLKSS